jgi:tRNA pseudouridine38-40 synthase
MRFRADLSYNGSRFYGWAKQVDLRTVQSEFEMSLSKILPKMWGKNVPTVVAGRTDTGVHAKHQVVHFDYPHNSLKEYDEAQLLYRLNAVLPKDIVCYKIRVVADDFSARFWATSRVYKYRISDQISTRNPIHRDDVFWIKHELDLELINRATRCLVGLNDFHAFVKPRKGQSSVRNLLKFQFEHIQEGADRGLIVATLEADAFAYNMVRSLIGASILVGSGRREEKWIEEKLHQNFREGATGPVAAYGLTLAEIKYDLSDQEARAREQSIKVNRQALLYNI